MQELTVSLSENILKISTIEKGEFKGVSAEVATDVVTDNKIIDSAKFATVFKELVNTISAKSLKDISVNIIVEPTDIFLKFVTLNKGNGDVSTQIIQEISSKHSDYDLNSAYFAYYKIAPFVYQFVAIQKDLLDQYLEITTTMGVSLKSVLPWVLLLPKFVNINEPAIFISKLAGKQIVALSEFNGIFFTNVYEKEKTTLELQKLVTELSVYKRNSPITKIYRYKYDSFSLNPDYQVLDLEIPNSNLEQAEGYDLHLLVDNTIDKQTYLLGTPVNLLNALPVPQIMTEKSKALVSVKSVGAVLLAVALVVGGLKYINRPQGNDQGSNTDQKEVLSQEAQQSVPTENTPTDAVSQEPAVELKKEELKIRVENAAGISGVAGRTQTFLEGLTYTVLSVGNSEGALRENTLLQFKPSKKAYDAMIKQDFGDKIKPETGADLAEDSEFDLLITLGADVTL